MTRLWHRVLSFFTPGTRMVLGLLLAAYLVTIIGEMTGIFSVTQDMALSGPAFWSGEIWRIVTYAMLPISLLSFLMNGMAIAFLGGSLERIWSRRELWFYCALVAIGAGALKVVIQPSSFFSLAGPAPLVFGLLAAWGFLFRSERLPLAGGGEITVGLIALVAGLINFVVLYVSAGPVIALIMAGGGLIGLLYLWVQARIVMGRKSRVAQSGRIQRLEI